jgi:prepilin-type N-terminal cleavage/methylation domain-containing protein
MSHAPSRKSPPGFTLIELLIVVVIIGILAAIAIPKFAATKQQAFVASMKGDLNNLVTAQEAYFTNYNTYANTFTSATTATTGVIWHPSAGNSLAFASVTSSGWNATMTNNYVPTTATQSTCGVFIGAASAPFTQDSLEGAPICKP